MCVCVCVFYYAHPSCGYGPLRCVSYRHSVIDTLAPVQKPTMRPAYRLSNTMLNSKRLQGYGRSGSTVLPASVIKTLVRPKWQIINTKFCTWTSSLLNLLCARSFGMANWQAIYSR